MERRIAVILSGCGKSDGSEIHESVHLLTGIVKAGAQYQCFAPDMEQMDVIDHYSGTESLERRGVLRESARIARGNILPLSEFRVSEFDGLALPGGFGAAKNLCTYAMAGVNATVVREVKEAIAGMHAAGKPIGALCIAPILLALVLGKGKITLGDADGAASGDARKLGMEAVSAGPRDVVVDAGNKLYTAACYMLPVTIADVSAAAEELARRMVGDIG